MQVLIVAPEDSIPEEFFRFIETQCEQALEKTDAPADCIRTIVFPVDESYGPCIQMFDPEATYSDNEVAHGVAKTIWRKDEGGQLSCSIVFRLAKIWDFWNEVTRKPQRSEWDPAMHLTEYMLPHEVGHCVDAAARGCPEQVPIVRPGAGFEISQVARYYAEILRGEFAACVFSARAMTAEGHQEEKDMFLRMTAESRERAGREWSQYQAKRQDLAGLARAAAECYWVILVQFAKITAIRLGNPALGRDDVLSETVFRAAAMRPVLGAFEEQFAEYWKAYPRWAPEVPAFMRTAWEQLALIDGYRFEENAQGSALYLNPLVHPPLAPFDALGRLFSLFGGR